MYLRTRSGAIYGGTDGLKPYRVRVEPVHVDVDISPLLQWAVQRENTHDIDEPPPAEDDEVGDLYTPTALDDLDVLPEMGDYVPLQRFPSPSDRKPSADPRAGKRRRKEAAEARRFWELDESTPHAKAVARHMAEEPLVLQDIDLTKAPAKKGAYGAKTAYFTKRNTVHNAASLEALGLRRVPWDGIHPKPVIVRNGVMAMCLIGRPDTVDYVVDCSNALDVIQDAGSRAQFKSVQIHHKRGRYPAINVGPVAGQGQTQPVPMATGKATPIVNELRGNKSIQRIMAFQSSALRLWAPKLYQYVKMVSKTIVDKLGIPMNFPRSVLPCVAFNFGKNVWTWAHQDVMNLAFNWCLITALGNHNATEGGFLIVWELGIFIEFPHAATIAIPSAVFTHSNTPVAEGETRTSITQYMPGGLARWVDAGCMTEKKLKETNTQGYADLQRRKDGRWKWGLSLLPRLDELDIE